MLSFYSIARKCGAHPTQANPEVTRGATHETALPELAVGIRTTALCSRFPSTVPAKRVSSGFACYSPASTMPSLSLAASTGFCCVPNTSNVLLHICATLDANSVCAMQRTTGSALSNKSSNRVLTGVHLEDSRIDWHI